MAPIKLNINGAAVFLSEAQTINVYSFFFLFRFFLFLMGAPLFTWGGDVDHVQGFAHSRSRKTDGSAWAFFSPLKNCQAGSVRGYF